LRLVKAELIMIKTIVAVVDFSDITSKVLDWATEQAKAFDARVIILHIVPKEAVVVGFGLASPVVLQPPTAEGIKSDYERLVALGDSLTRSGVNVLVEQMAEGTVEKLLEECRMWKADLLVLGSHHHSTIYKWFIGSFTADVLKAAFCPVVVIPAEEEES
jgi:nucleotide-binding universal stress UspA family protein